MNKTVVGTFGSRDQAERAVDDLRNKQGFDQEISVVAKDEQGGAKNSGNDPVSDGATTGGVLGGIAGLAVGAGMLTIPGLGPLLAAGPIAGALSGAATGGLAGGLADFGIPSAEGKQLEEKVKQGHTLVAVKADDNRAQKAAETLRKYQANDVKIHG